MRRLAAVIWDIDGTLIDSEPLHVEALLSTCRRYGAEMGGVNEKTFLGVEMAAVWEHINRRVPLAVSMAEWENEIARYYVQNISRALPRDRAVEAVRSLHRLGFRQACVSNSGRPFVDANLRQLNIDNLMEFSISRHDVCRGKPAPDLYRKACVLLGLPPETCIAIEDSPTGVEAASAAGLFTVAWPQDDGLRFPSADIVTKTLDDLFSWVGLHGTTDG